MEKLYLYEWTWQEVKKYLKRDSVIIVPFGSTEQHGLHLPLGNDALVAIRLAEDAARLTKTIVAPPCWYGWSPHHMAYPGTISLSPETLTKILYEVLRSLIYHGFKRLIVINGHRMANLPPLQIAASRIRNETGRLCHHRRPLFPGRPGLSGNHGIPRRRNRPCGRAGDFAYDAYLPGTGGYPESGEKPPQKEKIPPPGSVCERRPGFHSFDPGELPQSDRAERRDRGSDSIHRREREKAARSPGEKPGGAREVGPQRKGRPEAGNALFLNPVFPRAIYLTKNPGWAILTY